MCIISLFLRQQVPVKAKATLPRKRIYLIYHILDMAIDVLFPVMVREKDFFFGKSIRR
jgi:hypothetical protein